MKINILGLLVASSISSSSFGMWRAAATQLANARQKVANFLRTNATLNTIKAKPELLARRIKSVDINKVKLGALIAGNALVVGYGLDKIHLHNNPAFTAENINKYDETYVEHFIQQLPSLIKNQKPWTYENNANAVKMLLAKYPQAHQKIIDAIMQQDIATVNPRVFQVLLYRCPGFKPRFIKMLLEIDDIHCMNNLLFLDREDPRAGYIYFNNYIADDVVEYIAAHPEDVSIAAFNRLSRSVPHNKYFDKGELTTKLKTIALEKYGTPSLDDQIEFTIRKNPKKRSFTHPDCLFASSLLDHDCNITKHLYTVIAHDKILTAVIQSIGILSKEELQNIYYHVFKTDTERKQIKDAALAHFGKPSLDRVTSLQASPAFLFECTHEHTISECHAFIVARAAVIELLQKKSFEDTTIKSMFEAVHKKQKEERAKGNHLFVHGRRPDWEYMSDIYKQAYNTVHADKKVESDYTFLRFDNKSKTKFTNTTDGADALWMNAALYGNANHAGSCTAQYVLEGRDFSDVPAKIGISAQTIFQQLGLKDYYDTHKNELERLRQLHAKANPNNFGNLLAISIPEAELYRIKSPDLKGSIIIPGSWFPWKKSTTLTEIEHAVKSKKIRDHYEFVLPLTQDYALDPYNGPRIYSFNAADPEKFKEYEIARDQLFAKIRADIEADKKQQT